MDNYIALYLLYIEVWSSEWITMHQQIYSICEV